MENERIKSLVEDLNQYSDYNAKLMASNFAGSDVKAFKKYYSALHLELVEYIKFKKNKKLSEKAKDLLSTADLFKSTSRWIGALGLTIVFPGILLVYMLFADVEDWIMISTTIVVAVFVFVIIRQIQRQPQKMIALFKKNEENCKKVTSVIKKEEHQILTSESNLT